MAISHSTTTNQGNDDLPTINVPAGIDDGDFLILCLYKDGTDAITSLSGWTYKSAYSGDPGSSEMRVFTKTASSESGSYDFADIGGVEAWVVSLTVVKGSSGIDTGGAAQDLATTSITVASLTVAGDNSLALAFVQLEEVDSSSPPDGSWTEIFDVTEGASVTGVGASMYYKAVDSGSTGSMTFSYDSQSDEICAAVVVYGEAGGGGGATFTPRMMMY